ncbi:MAG: hypothetical protein L3K26_19685, partial [Candidatus Hydrogenedentes bacterium]|nr:hypothetical protein [Candidatus Hydrogenedentota bacterium]
WDVLKPVPLETCRKQGRILPWIDFRASMDAVFTQSLRAGAERVHQLDPQARVGFQPDAYPPSVRSGLQWSQLCAAMDYVVVPNDPNAIRRLQSFHGIHPWSGVVVDGSLFQRTADQARHFAWRCALEQLPAIWLNEPFADPATRLLGPLGAASPVFTAFGDARSEINRGLGALLLRATPYHNNIAFLDTPESNMLAAVLPENKVPQQKSETWFADTLNVLGFAPVLRSLLPELGQTLDDINTVILADTQVLTEVQRSALTEFHKGGGLIVASRLPNSIDASPVETGPGALSFLHPLRKTDDAPELWCNRPVWARKFDATWATGQQLEALLLRAGNLPMPKFKFATKQRDLLRRYYYAYGAATIVAFLPDQDLTRPLKQASIPIPKGHYAYDLRSPEPLASRNRYHWRPMPGEAAIIAVLPYRVKELILTAPPSANSGERLSLEISLDTEGAESGPHLVSLRIEGPDGKELAHYFQVAVAREGRAEAFIPLAQNEAPGRYTIVATDLLSGISQHTFVSIQ